MCTFGKFVYAGENNNRQAAKRFKTVLDHTCLRAILSRFHHFNQRGGAFVRMQDQMIHFERACMVGIFADLPAATKLTLTGSSCNTCFMPRDQMAVPHAIAPLRTWENMAVEKTRFLDRIDNGEPRTVVLDEAKRIGVNCHVVSAFAIPPSGINPIGPDPQLDHPWGCCPPVFLHGMESGTLMKVCEASMHSIIRASETLGISATQAMREIDAYAAKVYIAKVRNSNVELGKLALQPQPHGISNHILTGKAVDGHKRESFARLMHLYLSTCQCFSDHQRMVHCQMYEIMWECREQMSWPLHRSRLEYVQARLNTMDRMLVAYLSPFSPSGCKSEKHHQWSHYSLHRLNTGCAAKEYSFERSYAVGHKKKSSSPTNRKPKHFKPRTNSSFGMASTASLST